MWGLICFNEGKDYRNENGWPDAVWFLLSDKGVTSGERFGADDGFSAVDEITGRSYRRLSLRRPLSVNGVLSFGELVWATVNESGWSTRARSLVAATSRDNNGYLLCAWDIQESGESRNMSRPDTTLRLTPVFSL